MADYLPEEVLSEILSRLPVKQLIQFKCVSKRWSSLISSPSFIALHLEKSNIKKNRNDLFLFRYFNNDLPGGGKEYYLIYPDGNFPCFPLEVVDCQFKSARNCYVSLVGSCNGVVCLADDVVEYNHRYVLWNPCVRKTLAVPRPNVTFVSHGPFMHSLGFGFDSVSNDYKLVRVVYLRCFTSGYDETPLAEVYSLRSRAWRMVECRLECFIMEHSVSVFVNGACHWVADSPLKDSFHGSVIVVFSVNSEAFGKMAVPDGLVWENVINSSVAVLDGRLSLVPFNRGFGKEFCSVWVMKEYGISDSWIKLFNVENFTGLQRLVTYGKDGQFLLAGQDGILMCCDAENAEHRGTIAKGEVGSFYFNTYVESLVLLDESNGSLEGDPSAERADEAYKEYVSFVADADNKRDKMKKEKKAIKSSGSSILSNVAICKESLTRRHLQIK